MAMRSLIVLGVFGATALAGPLKVAARGVCDPVACGNAASNAGIACGPGLAAGEFKLPNNVTCAVALYEGLIHNTLTGSECITCVNEVQGSIEYYLGMHPSATVAPFPATTGGYQSGYQTQYAQETAVFTFPVDSASPCSYPYDPYDEPYKNYPGAPCYTGPGPQDPQQDNPGYDQP